MKALKYLIKKRYLKLLDTFLGRYYRSYTEIPIAAFTEALSGNYGAIGRNRFCSNPYRAKKIWKNIFDEHLRERGLPDAFNDYMRLMLKAQEAYDKAVNHGQKWMIVKAKVYHSEANLMFTTGSESIQDTCAKVSKFMGFPVKADTCSASEFHSYLKLMSN